MEPSSNSMHLARHTGACVVHWCLSLLFRHSLPAHLASGCHSSKSPGNIISVFCRLSRRAVPGIMSASFFQMLSSSFQVVFVHRPHKRRISKGRAKMAVTLIELLLKESEALPLVELIWPPERVVAGLRVCTLARRKILEAAQSGRLRVHLCISSRGVTAGRSSETECGDNDYSGIGFSRFGNARLQLTITPSRSSPVPVAVFSELYRSMRSGDCAGPIALNLSNCYWNWGEYYGAFHTYTPCYLC